MSHGFTRVACILLLLTLAVYVRAQRAPEKPATGSINGTVTVKGKAAAGVVVDAKNSNNTSRRERHRATTDDLGNYHITNLPAGRYEVSPATQLFNLETKDAPRALFLSEGESVSGVDFALLRGGAITGKVTNAESQPLIEESISLWAVSALPQDYQKSVQTDDRGIYRFFGVRPGKYRVSAGQTTDGLGGGARPVYKRRYYPEANDEPGATVIEVTEGSEVVDVDIVLGRPLTTYKVRGRILDGETGKPLANVRYGLMRTHGESSNATSGGPPTNNAGEFTIENLFPGKYSVYVVPWANDVRSEPFPFEVIDRDLKDVVIKTNKGASVAGVVVFEGSDVKTGIPANKNVLIHVWVNSQTRVPDGNPPISVNKDGSFRLGGLPPGTARFSVFDMMGRPGVRRLGILRVERNGVVQPEGVEIKAGEEVTGLRLTIAEFNGAIRGLVKWDNDETPALNDTSVAYIRIDDNGMKPELMGVGSQQWDSRGNFLIEGLAPGTYEVRVHVQVAGLPNLISSKQQVTVTNNSVTEVTLIVPRKPGPE